MNFMRRPTWQVADAGHPIRACALAASHAFIRAVAAEVIAVADHGDVDL